MSFFKKRGSGWQLADQSEMAGQHEVTDFKLDQLGELLGCETETDQTGWVIVKPSWQNKHRRRDSFVIEGRRPPGQSFQCGMVGRLNCGDEKFAGRNWENF